MADGNAAGIGLAVGSARLTAVHVGRTAVRRSAVLTRFAHRPPEVGVPSENPGLTERGLILTDFVDRVGDPVPMLAKDGSSHRPEAVLADALRAMIATLPGRTPADRIAVAYPAHWRPAAVEALRGALAAVPELRTPVPALLVSDATAALTALQQDPGVPARGVIAVCDFGATGTSITLADASRGFQQIGATERNDELSGELIDQALLKHLVASLSSSGDVDVSGTSAIGSLSRLRAQCRVAKERLSTEAVAALPVDLPGAGGDVRITRTELDEAVRAPLAGFIADLQDVLQRNRIRPTDLVAVASVGGGARIPIITTTLSEHMRVPIVTGRAPELAAAIGAGLRAARSTVVEGATSMAPAASAAAAASVAPVAPSVPPPPEPPAPPVQAPASANSSALAWSEAHDVPDVAESARYGDDGFDDRVDAGESARPRIDFELHDPEERGAAVIPWYRRPGAIIGAAVVGVLALVGAVVTFIVLADVESSDPSEQSTPSDVMTVTPVPSGSQTDTGSPSAPSGDPQDTFTYTEQAPPTTVTETAPPVVETPPPAEPPPAEAPPAEAPPAEAPPAQAPPAETQPPPPPQAPSSTTIFTVPGPVPIPIPIPIPG